MGGFVYTKTRVVYHRISPLKIRFGDFRGNFSSQRRRRRKRKKEKKNKKKTYLFSEKCVAYSKLNKQQNRSRGGGERGSKSHSFL